MNWTRINQIRRLLRVSFGKTIFFNFKMLPFRQAVKLPILLTRNIYFYSLNGRVELLSEPHFGMIRFGFFGEDTVHPGSNVTILQIDGVLKMSSNVHFGNGMTIRILNNAVVTLENNIKINNRTKIICYDSITIRHDSRFAWECQVIDTSFHYIRNMEDRRVSNLNSPISIGAHNWIGNRVNIMKGTHTPDYTIVGAGSLLNKVYDVPEYSLMVGTPAKLVKTGIYRCLDEEEAEIKKSLNK